jgi:hypothetical protein
LFEVTEKLRKPIWKKSWLWGRVNERKVGLKGKISEVGHNGILSEKS